MDVDNKEWVEFFGRSPDKVFKDGASWWSRVDPDKAMEAKEKGKTHPVDNVTIYPVYAYPERVEGGQKYDVCIH